MSPKPPADKPLIEQPAAPGAPKKFGTLSGVFVPTLLTILGVIMYLREGYVIGEVGLGAALAIIALAFAITGATGLSLATVTTNIRIGAGGAYSVISQSLGIELGGAIGLPLYLSQTLAVVMYIFGFREGWRWIFPGHPALAVDLLAFAVLFAIAFISASLAFRVQWLILAVIVGSLVSVAAAAVGGSMTEPITWFALPRGGFTTGHFWMVFAVFFPAATGIMAGANMSGELANPRRAIPVGTLAAIALSLVVYVLLAFWLARSASMAQLRDNYTVMIDKAAWGPAVVAGLLGATFSSALASLVGAPRIVQALARHRILPAGDWLGRRSAGGEPRNGLYLTGAIVLLALLLRDLNTVAPLITMFFLITYAMINVVVYLEQHLALVSFRPLFRVPRVVPLIGAIGCLAAMFIVNAVFGLVALAVVVAVYSVLIRRHLDAPFGDVRSGIFVALAEWAAKKVSDLPSQRERGWKPNLLVAVENPPVLRGSFRLVHSLTYPRGSVKIVGLHRPDDKPEQFAERLARLAVAFREEGVFSSWTRLQTTGYAAGVASTMEALGGVFFKPNVVFLPLNADDPPDRLTDLASIVGWAPSHGLGAMVFAEHPYARLGRRATINLWAPDAGPEWAVGLELGDLNLAILLAYKLKRNWHAELRLIARVPSEQQRQPAELYLRTLAELARLPDAEPIVRIGLPDELKVDAPPADLHVLCMPHAPADCRSIVRARDELEASVAFVRSAGTESALA